MFGQSEDIPKALPVTTYEYKNLISFSGFCRKESIVLLSKYNTNFLITNKFTQYGFPNTRLLWQYFSITTSGQDLTWNRYLTRLPVKLQSIELSLSSRTSCEVLQMMNRFLVSGFEVASYTKPPALSGSLMSWRVLWAPPRTGFRTCVSSHRAFRGLIRGRIWA